MVKRKFNAKLYVIVLIAVGLSGVIAGYIMTSNSAAFAAARAFLVSNPEVVEALGPIQSTRLGFNYSVGYRGGEGSAKITVVLTGQRRSADVYLTLDSVDGVWRVKSGNLILNKEDHIPLIPKKN